jgi:YVTN family beta-propeller protein
MSKLSAAAQSLAAPQKVSSQIETVVKIGPAPGWEHIGMLSPLADGRRLLVTSQEGDCLSIVNTEHRIVESTIALRKGGVPWHAKQTPDGRFVLVTNTEFSGHVDTCSTLPSTVSVVDLKTRTQVREIPVGAGPVMLETDARRQRAYVTNRVSCTLSVIELESWSVVATLPTGRAPFWVAMTAREDLLVVANFEDASLSLIDPDTLETRRVVQVGVAALEEPDPEYGKGDTMGVTIRKDGVAYVANWRSNELVTIDLYAALVRGEEAILGRQHVVEHPFAITLDESLGLMAIGSYEVQDSRIVVLDLETGRPGSHELIAEIPSDGSVAPTGRAAQANYWFNVPFETKIMGLIAQPISEDVRPPDFVAAVL